MKKRIYIISIVALLLFAAAISVYADVGNSFSDDFGGGWDNGGGNDYDFGSNYGSNYNSNYSTDYGDEFFEDNPWIVGLVIAGFLVVFIFLKKGGKSRTGQHGQSIPMTGIAMPEEQVINKIRENDPDFSPEQFKAFAKDVFIRVQEAWEAKDWAVVRPFESDKLYNAHERQLREFIESRKTNHIDGQDIKSVLLTDTRTEGVNEVLVIRLNASVIDYTTDDVTGKITQGDMTTRYNRFYKLEFIRTAGVKTNSSKDALAHACPSCGAPIELNSSGRCEYCLNVVTSGEYGWVLNDYGRF